MNLDAVLLVLWSASTALASNVTSSTPAAVVCERAPPHAQPADGNYKLSVAGDPDLFLPGELYTDVDCRTGPWLGWSQCYGVCEYALKLNYRIVVRVASGAGKPCGRLVKRRACMPAYCRHMLVGTATTTPSPDDDLSWPSDDDDY